LQDRLASRDDIRDQNQQERQDRRDEARQDWHDRYDDIYDRHEDWHHGHWDDFGDWWGHMWDDHTALMAFGTTMWGINRAAYAFGYWGYSNPYYTESYPIDGGGYIDYSQPIAVDSQPVVVEPQPAVVEAQAATAQTAAPPAPGIADFDLARQAFYQGDYAAALASTNKALAALPNDPIIHEFRALVLFAQGKYKEAGAGLYSVLSVGPGWDWTTLSSLYPSVDAYTKQLRGLEQYLREHPDDNAARFVLAYHYMTTANKDAAAGQLKELYKQTPQDELIKQLLVMTGGPEAVGAPPIGADTAAPATPAAPAIPAADVVGKWNAAGEGDAKFAMELSKDGNFSWTFTQSGKPQTVQGVYALDGNVLAMEPESGGVMLAELTPPQAGRFDFHLLGAPPGDPGLKFSKSQ
jgi:uncharacterized protein (TIGR03066 family)